MLVRILILLVAFLAMVGGGIGGLYYWGIDPIAKFNQLIGRAPQAEVAAAPPPVVLPGYVEFGLLTVPVVQGKDIKYQVDMIIRLEVIYDKREVIAHNLPRIQNSFLHDLMSFLPGHMRETAQVDIPTVQQRLIIAANKVLEPGFVKNVRIDQLMIKGN